VQEAKAFELGVLRLEKRSELKITIIGQKKLSNFAKDFYLRFSPFYDIV